MDSDKITLEGGAVINKLAWKGVSKKEFIDINMAHVLRIPEPKRTKILEDAYLEINPAKESKK